MKSQPSFNSEYKRDVQSTERNKSALYDMLMADIRDFEQKKERLSLADQEVLARMKIEAASLGRQLEALPSTKLRMVRLEAPRYSQEDAMALHKMLRADIGDFERDLENDMRGAMSEDNRKRLAEVKREATAIAKRLGLTPKN